MDRTTFDQLASSYGLTAIGDAGGETVLFALTAPTSLSNPDNLLGTQLGLGTDVTGSLPTSAATLSAFQFLRSTDDNGNPTYSAQVGLTWSANFSITSELALPSLSSPALTLQVDWRGGKVKWSLQLRGLITFTASGNTATVSAQLNLPTGIIELNLLGPASLRCLADALNFGPAIDLSGLQLASAGLSVNVRTGALSVGGALQDVMNVPFDTSLGTGSFSLNWVELAYRRNRYGSSGRVVGASTFQFNGCGFDVSVSYGWGDESGLRFVGALTPGSMVRLASLCRGMDLPSMLASANISQATITYDGLTKRFAFTGTLSSVVTLGSHSLDFSFSLSVDRGGLTTLTTLQAVVMVDGLQFNVNLAKSQAQTVLVATYANPAGQALSLKNLIAALQPGSLAQSTPAGLNFQLQSALVAFGRTPASGATPARNKFLLGAEIASGFNLTDLPMIGAKLPAGKSVRMVFQPVAASDTFTADELAAIVAAIPAGGPQLTTENALASGISVQSTLYFGDRSVNLSLPIQVGSSGQIVPAPSPGTSSAPGATTSGASATSISTLPVEGVRWFAVQQRYGPVYLNRVGIRYSSNQVSVYLGAAVTAGGLTISCEGLSVTTPLSSMQPVFGLLGLGLDFRQGGLEIAGALLRRPVAGASNQFSYDGIAILKTSALSLSAIGSYTTDQNGNPSLFIYAFLNKAIGGPSFFFVTGVAAGFGYNRSLILPALEQVGNFPLVRQATAASNGQPPPTLTDTLTALASSVVPSPGARFLAVGVKFTSFKLIDSFALLTLSFGVDLRFNLLGLSTAQIPPPSTSLGVAAVTPIAFVRMALDAYFKPSIGVLSVRATLTSESYIISTRCNISGGFAFMAWFQQGDFVLSLGGYHPQFNKPAHYPRVDRLGFNWQVDNELNFKGSSYAALTPCAVMAGGSIEALWQDDGKRAWFTAGADFLLSWKPYYYDIRIYVSGGVRHYFWGEFDASAELHIWGPDFSGTAKLRVSCFSVEVEFGRGAAAPTGIAWQDFKTSFLPGADKIYSVAVQGGQVSGPASANDLGAVNPVGLCLLVNTTMPAKSATIGANAVAVSWNTDFGIYPMGLSKDTFTNCQLTLDITRNGSPANHLFQFTAQKKAAPQGLWGSGSGNPFNVIAPALNSPQLVSNTLAGFEIKPKDPPVVGATSAIGLDALQNTPNNVDSAFAFETPKAYKPVQPLAAAARQKQLADALADPAAAQARLSVLAALGVDTVLDPGDAQQIATSFLIAPTVGVYA